MRGLVPNKRELHFNRESVDRIIRWFELNYPDTPMNMLHHLFPPTQGDLTWASFAVTNDKSSHLVKPNLNPTIKKRK